jgi:MerR family redox-sensitive transcriptional activator SoxR
MIIGEVAQKTGVPASTLRYYESIGLIPAPPRISGRRHYDEGVLQRMAIIRVARQTGWTLDEIKELLHGMPEQATPSAQWRALATHKIEELDALIERTQEMKRILEDSLACVCNDLDECELIEIENQ